MSILVCNAGSSSLKFSLFGDEGEDVLLQGNREVTGHDHAATVERIIGELKSGALKTEFQNLRAVGHRVVHGGARFTEPTLISSDVKQTIAELSELAPLHNSPSLAVIETVGKIIANVPQIAVFDTAFHATLSETTRTYAIPRRWTREWGIRRFGFHGLSHAYCASRAAELLGRSDARLVIAHLGNGASMSAVRAGVSINTTMGFTPLEGLVMGTRSGNVDPGILIYLLKERGVTVNELDHALNFESGLFGVSGISNDLRELLAAQAENPDARLAIDVYVERICQSVGAMTAMLNGIDVLVFTAGVGEHSSEIRERVCENLSHLGVEIEKGKNNACKFDCDIASSRSSVRVLVIATREDLTIVREVRKVVI